MLFSGNFETQEYDVLSLKFFVILWQSLKLHPLLTESNNNSNVHNERNQLHMHLHVQNILYMQKKRRNHCLIHFKVT